MQLLVFTAVGLVCFLLAVGFGLGGTIGALIFLSIVLIGATLRAWGHAVDWLRGPSSGL